MTRLHAFSTFVLAALLLSGCANSVINDPEEMARRHAYVAQQQERHERFWGRVIGPGPSTNAQAPQAGSPGLYQSGAATPRQCRAIGGTWNYGSGFCWRL
jgi:hypothetical protein